jgi:hypothetical protein
MRFFFYVPRDIISWPIWVVQIIRNVFIDIRYGGILSGELKTRFAHLEAVETGSSDYSILSNIFDDRIKNSDVLVDVGCGKGRVINSWLHSGYHNQMIGIELDEDIAAQTRNRLRKYDNITIIAGNIIENIPKNGTLFYLFHPFGPTVMQAFKNRLMTIFDGNSDLTILYYNCKHVNIFQNDPAWNVEIVKVKGPPRLPVESLAVITIK